MPEPDVTDFSFEGLCRVLVDRERTGFEQCRDALVSHLRQQIAPLELDNRAYPGAYDTGRLDALQDLLAFLLKDQPPTVNGRSS